jgi:hypothetical protein
MKKKIIIAGVAVLVLGAGAAIAAEIVDQGRPGVQGAWPVTCVSGCSGGSGGGGGGSLATDGGFLGTVLPAPCKRYVQAITDAGTTAITIPTSGLSTNRVYIDVCNSILNPSPALCTCSAVSVPASVGLGVVGDTLATGDCQRYPTVFDGGNPWCVCNQSNVQLNSSECGS